MTPDAVDRIRTHRQALAARWARQIADLPRAAAPMRHPERIARDLVAGLDGLVEAASAARTETFTAFTARLSQALFGVGVPLDQVIRALLQLKPVVLDFLAEHAAAPGDATVTIGFLDHVLSLGILEALAQHERHQARRALAIEEQIAGLRDQLRRQSPIDPDTALYTAEYFTLALRREVIRSRRFGRTFTVGLLASAQADARRAAGEPAGRALARHLAGLLIQHTRHVDVRAALSGGRFGLLFPETPLEGARIAAERIRRAAEASPLALPDPPITVALAIGVGLAAYPDDGQDEAALLARADAALAEAHRTMPYAQPPGPVRPAGRGT